jgi:hypothetical protein
MRGGTPYSSAASYGGYVNGSGNAQYNRVLAQAGPYGEVPGNAIISVDGKGIPSPSQIPTAGQLALVQKAGKRRRRKGGFLGAVINQAVVPFGLLAMQQSYKRKRGGSRRRHTRKHRR